MASCVHSSKRNCINCNKELANTTKGELCITCYRNRNKPKDYEITDTFYSSVNDVIEESNNFMAIPLSNLETPIMDGNTKMDNNTESLPFYNSDNKLVDFIQNSMIHERKRDADTIELLNNQIAFLKDEIQHKNAVINKLMRELTVVTQEDDKHSNYENNDCATYNKSDLSSSTIASVDVPIFTDYLQWQAIDEGSDVSERYTTDNISDETTASEVSDEHTTSKINHDDMRTENVRSTVVDEFSDFEKVYAKNARKRKKNKNNQRQPKIEIAPPQIRPSVVTNKFPERDNMAYVGKKHVPGNSTYADMAGAGKKIAIISDSMCRGMKITKLNNALENKHAYKRIFPGATPSDMQYYCVRTLELDKPDIAIIHSGTNRVGKDDPFTIANDIVKIVKTCQEGGCNTVFVSEIIYKPDYPDIVQQVNNILRTWQFLHDFKLIYNENIQSNCICGDNVHLNNKGKLRLCSNFRRALNNTRHI